MNYYERKGLAVLFFASVFLPVSASAATVAAQAGVRTVTCTTFCGGPGATAVSDIAGGEGFTAANATVSGSPGGNGRGRAHLGGAAIALPTLGAEALPDTSGDAVADAGAMQKYIYNGPDNSPFVLQLQVDGEIGGGSGQPDTAGLSAYAAVVLANSLRFSVDPATFIGEYVELDPAATLVKGIGFDFGTLNLFDTGPQLVTDDLSFTLDNGDEVFIYASLRVRATRGAIAAAYSSLSLVFTSGDVAGLHVVPLPAPVLLLGSALGLLGFTRRHD